MKLCSSPGKALKTLNNSKTAVTTLPYQDRCVSRSGSVPNLASSSSQNISKIQSSKPITISPILKSHMRHHNSRNSNTVINRGTREKYPGTYLHPSMLQYHRQALSVDESGPFYAKHLNIRDGMETNFDFDGSRNRDKTKRSDTARKHVLSRQKPIEKDEIQSPNGSKRYK